MRWLRRSLWLLAWGGWAWLGVGLHRELPRHLGPAVCALPVGPGDALLGFIGESDHVAFLQNIRGTLTTIRVFNGVDGSLVRETPGPPEADYAYPLLNHGDPNLVFANEAPGRYGELVPGLHRLDLATGEWRRLSNLVGGAVDALDAKRGVGVWVKSGMPPNRFLFTDLNTGAVLAEHQLPPGWAYIGPPHVAVGPGLAVLPQAIWPKGAPAAERMTLEVWRLGPSPTFVRSIDVTGHDQWLSVSPDGRAALSRADEHSSVDVYDLANGRRIYASPPYAGGNPSPNQGGGVGQPILSPSGRTAFDGGWGTLWDLETNRALWRRRSHETPLSGRDPQFILAEEWSTLWKKWFPLARLETKACRDAATGRLAYRVAAGYDALPLRWNAACTLSASLNGTIRRGAPLPNWPLILFCQSILALPLILLWAILRWRTKRVSRREVTPRTRTDAGAKKSTG